ncbi:MAG: NAD-dependent epimerase/dehydratase family protein, partial [archaeon]|nr:NAD-dependent epimerase/dehydratase family protein [archaeon]
MEKNSKIYIAGHKGLLGSSLIRILEEEGFTNCVVRKKSELDLRDQQMTSKFFEEEKPDYVFLAAAK